MSRTLLLLASLFFVAQPTFAAGSRSHGARGHGSGGHGGAHARSGGHGGSHGGGHRGHAVPRSNGHYGGHVTRSYRSRGSSHGFLGVGHLFSGHHHDSLALYYYPYGYRYAYGYGSYAPSYYPSYGGGYAPYGYGYDRGDDRAYDRGDDYGADGVPYDGANAAEVRVLVTPREAEVRVDGYYAGTANDFDGYTQRLRLAPGRHDVELSLPGYRTERLSIDLAPGATVRLQRALTPDRERYGVPPAARDDRDDLPRDYAETRGDRSIGTVRLSVEPPDAAVYVDGRIAGDARSLRTLTLAPGAHRLEAVRPGFRSASRNINIVAGVTTSVVLTLVPNR